MVARQTQSPTTTPDKVTRLSEMHAELRREVGRGAQALADSDGNALTMSGGDWPQLTSSAFNVAVGWTPSGTLAVTTASGLTAAPLSAGNVHCTNLYYSGSLIPSDAQLKEGFRPVDQTVLDRLLATPVQVWRWRSRPVQGGHGDPAKFAPDDREHIHPTAQDMPVELTATGPDGNLAVDPLSVTGALLALVQRQQAQIDRLTHRVAALEHAPTTPPNPGPTTSPAPGPATP